MAARFRDLFGFLENAREIARGSGALLTLSMQMVEACCNFRSTPDTTRCYVD